MFTFCCLFTWLVIKQANIGIDLRPPATPFGKKHFPSLGQQGQLRAILQMNTVGENLSLKELVREKSNYHLIHLGCMCDETYIWLTYGMYTQTQSDIWRSILAHLLIGISIHSFLEHQSLPPSEFREGTLKRTWGFSTMCLLASSHSVACILCFSSLFNVSAFTNTTFLSFIQLFIGNTKNLDICHEALKAPSSNIHKALILTRDKKIQLPC